MKILTPDEFKKLNQTRTSKKVKTTGSNQLTKAIIQFLSVNGFEVFRANVTGIFDATKAAREIINLIKGVLKTRRLPNNKEVRSLLSRCYRKTHERKGVSDIMGFEKNTGRFVAIEVKYGKDKLSIHQIDFLQRVVKNGGIAIVAKTFDQFVKDLNEQNYYSQKK